jgi:peptidyl-prolyl cis-trans isomerase SurA
MITRLTSIALAAIIYLGLPLATQAQEQHLDGIAAIVDDSIVLESQLNQRLQAIKQRFAGSSGQLPSDEVLREQLLDRLILEELQLQMASRGGIRISEAELTDAIQRVAASNGMTGDDFINSLAAQGENVNQIVLEIRNEMILQQLQQIQVSQRIFISEAEVTNFLNSEEGRFWTAPDYNLQHILLPLTANASPQVVQAAQQSVNEIQQALDQGADFSTLAVQYSGAPNALEGGNLGWRKAAEFPSEIADQLNASSAGDITRAIRSAGGIHIFKVNEVRRAEDMTMVQQTKSRHILLSPNEIRSEEETRQLADEIYDRLAEGENFEELAETYSEDISNALRGGDLGWAAPGQFVPEFEQTMNATAIGELGGPVRSQFGWHIIRVDDRRQIDMTDDLMRQQARNLLASQRFDEELDLWLRELKSDAFIEVLDDT